MHPVHKAYLNFYLALSHDTMAREARMKNRHAELELAEKHYLTAISVLTPSHAYAMTGVDGSDSPTSTDSAYHSMLRRPSDAASFRSDHSSSTSTTSFNSGSSEVSEESCISNKVAFATTSLRTRPVEENVTAGPKTKLPPIDTHSESQASPQGDKLSTDLFAFVNMVKSHLASVRELKESPAPTSNRHSFTRARYPTANSRPPSQTSLHNEPGMDEVRGHRRRLSFRPRFDPSSVQKLCADVLDEL